MYIDSCFYMYHYVYYIHSYAHTQRNVCKRTDAHTYINHQIKTRTVTLRQCTFNCFINVQRTKQTLLFGAATDVTDVTKYLPSF